jgi:hypothetical protein
MKNKTNSVFDVLKILLSLMVIIIHGKVLNYIALPWIRMAVPLFFMMSSYFVFKKLNKETEEKQKTEIVKKFITRNLKLYLIWFIILLPITLSHRGYITYYGYIKGFFVMVRDFFTFGTFPSSWYIMALVEGFIMIYFCSKKVNNKILLIYSLIMYFAITVISADDFVFASGYPHFFNVIFPRPHTCLFVSFLGITIGKMFADKEIKYNRIINLIVLIISGILLYLEWRTYVYRICYIALIPFVVSIFNIALNIKPFTIKGSMFLRKSSTIIYVTHGSFIYIYNKLLLIENMYLVMIITLISSLIVTVIIDKLSNYIKFLKNAY